jgi:mannose-6-phosphate isomerase-like protein (cupin superfamily)
MEYHAPPEFAGPPPHLHKITTEMFYVLEGALTLRVGDQTRQVGAGGYAYVPPGHLHGFANETEMAAKFLGISTPGVLDDYLVEMKALVESQPEWPPSDPSQFLALMNGFDTYMPDGP